MSGMIPPSLGPSGHVDDFTRRNLPPLEQWPNLLLDRPEFQYPEYINAAVELTDRIVEKGLGDQIALIGNGRQRTYKELSDWSNRLAHALVENYGVKPGNRVLIRSGNNPALVAAWLAATKAGAVVVNTMPLLRAGELSKIIDKAEIALALTDSRIADELVACAKTSRFLKQVVNFDGTSNHDAELDRIALSKPVRFEAVKTGRDERRIVARADQDAIAGLDAVILHQRMRQAVRPVGEFLVGALTAVADQRDVIAESLLDIPVGQFDRGVEIFRILKLRAIEQQFRPQLGRRQVSPGKIIDVAGWAKRWGKG